MDLKKSRDKIQENFHLTRKRDFDKVQSVMTLMPSFGLSLDESTSFSDIYYETKDNFLSDMGVTLRSRNFSDKKIISVKYSEELMKLQDDTNQKDIHEHEISSSSDISDEENLLFIEDKLNIIFSNKLQIDILRKLKSMSPIYTINTKRKSFKIVHNSGFRAKVNFDQVTYINNKTNVKDSDNILEVHMKSVYTDLNKKFMNDFIADIKTRVTLIPMFRDKFETSKLMTRFKK